MRCFVAVPLPDDVRAAAVRAQDEVRRACEGADIRWVRPESMHLTLKFLGNVDEARVPAVGRALAGEIPRHALGRLALGGLGAFPTPHRARVVWLAVREGAAALAAVASAVDRTLAGLSFDAEARPITPHLTLGRVRDARRAPDLRPALAAPVSVDAGAWSPRAVVLFESRLRPSGAVHRAIDEYPLG
jgi:2'-5' RNA ligase